MIGLLLSFYLGGAFALFVQNLGAKRASENLMGARLSTRTIFLAACLWPYVLWHAERNSRAAAKQIRAHERRRQWEKRA